MPCMSTGRGRDTQISKRIESHQRDRDRQRQTDTETERKRLTERQRQTETETQTQRRDWRDLLVQQAIPGAEQRPFADLQYRENICQDYELTPVPRRWLPTLKSTLPVNITVNYSGDDSWGEWPIETEQRPRLCPCSVEERECRSRAVGSEWLVHL